MIDIEQKNFIHVFKQDILNIKRIEFQYCNIRGINLTNSSIDLSKLEELSKLFSIQILIYFNCIIYF